MIPDLFVFVGPSEELERRQASLYGGEKDSAVPKGVGSKLGEQGILLNEMLKSRIATLWLGVCLFE